MRTNGRSVRDESSRYRLTSEEHTQPRRSTAHSTQPADGKPRSESHLAAGAHLSFDSKKCTTTGPQQQIIAPPLCTIYSTPHVRGHRASKCGGIRRLTTIIASRSPWGAPTLSVFALTWEPLAKKCHSPLRISCIYSPRIAHSAGTK